MHNHSHHGHSHHGHDHHGHQHDHAREGNKKGLAIALTITFGIMFLEFFGGLVTNSLALLSDSGHMLSDASALALSLIALWFSSKPSSAKRTFGFHRFEILTALFNGIVLFIIAGVIVWEAVQRFDHPPEVASGSMMLIASVGLLANIGSAIALMRKGDVKNNLNLRSAYIHVIGDALGSVGAIVAGIVMMAFKWYLADPIISILVALLILKSAWGVISHTIHILMEGAPAAIDQTEVKNALLAIEGVEDVHDLHIWTITSGFDSLSGHVLIRDGEDNQIILQKAIHILEEQFHIEHSTIQVETAKIHHGKLNC
ncbi:cation diffusion facilitator family transporter [Paenibacillus sp. alder61]|uniref:cation diffusion facilitator family transporter n=1 Tax=Paenibacillus sp. alder61 TaxID=2862948 RepID=UPI001CD2C6E8|nr:cation diffusion facilitator family transporter [Paenibacillus sp. alder61]MCA1295349.1 cation diffusion facilitator family transporter [Paenibacillus sp. alder61]